MNRHLVKEFYGFLNLNLNLILETIAIIGLGYVGLPLAVAFAEKYSVIGFDTDPGKINAIRSCGQKDADTTRIPLTDTGALEKRLSEGKLQVTADEEPLKIATVFIIAVPTPVDAYHVPDLSALLSASAIAGRALKKGDLVVYESTVYPGCTEEDCVPVLENASGLVFNNDFLVGYSPERINPGDKIHTLETIKKIVSGSSAEALAQMETLYGSIIRAGIYPAPSLKVAEAAKVIENAQRDVNISFVNELALIFDRMGIDTEEVLKAAGTKWNFLAFRPGLVGGHCIGVDPYYLAHKAQQLGYIPEVILSGRRVNNSMGSFIVQKVVKLLIQRNVQVREAKVLILGIAFKENCPDIRNSRVTDIYRELKEYGVSPEVVDPFADKVQVEKQYGIRLEKTMDTNRHYDAIILAVAHSLFLEIDFGKYQRTNCVIYDVKGVLPRKWVTARL